MYMKSPHWLWPTRTKKQPGASFNNDFSLLIQISMATSFHCSSIPGRPITTDVVACAKLCSAHFIRIWLEAEQTFHQIWITLKILLMKWATDPCWTDSEYFVTNNVQLAAHKQDQQQINSYHLKHPLVNMLHFLWHTFAVSYTMLAFP